MQDRELDDLSIYLVHIANTITTNGVDFGKFDHKVSENTPQ